MPAAVHSALTLGSSPPPFSLPGVDGQTWSLDSFADAPVLVVVFTCNHCPAAKAYEDRLVAIQKDYAARGVRLCAINPNDHHSHPEDSFENMKIRAEQKHFNFPYLRDEPQTVARAYGAACTPDPFVSDRDRKLVYAGRIDDSTQNAQRAQRHDLRRAIELALEGRGVDFDVYPAVGCSIKWRK
jgi:peroxiredoxin